MKRLQDKRAVITGAANGIGKAIAEGFAAEGAKLILADIDTAGVEKLAAQLGQTARVTNVASKAELDALFDFAEQSWGGLDILVNNAGVTHACDIDALTEEDFDRVMAINLKSAVFGTQRAARLMGSGGIIINMSSVNAIGPGTIMTDLARSIMTDRAAEDRVMSRTPMGRTGAPEEVATIAVFLACDESSYITGQTIYPDGGRLGLNYTVPVRERD